MFLQCFHNHKWHNQIQECYEEQNHPGEGEGERDRETKREREDVLVILVLINDIHYYPVNKPTSAFCSIKVEMV